MAHHKRLQRRYGRARGRGGPRVVYRSPTGALVWATAPGSDLQIMWAGPGSRLRMGLNLTKAGSSFPTAIEHPSADGEYRTAKAATAAVRAFLKAGSS